MAAFGSIGRYDRALILTEAARACAKKRRKRAIALYRRVLAVEPLNVELHAKLAPLLAETGQHFDARESFHEAARAWLREGNADRAEAVYREATGRLPRDLELWQAIAELQRAQGREQEALKTLLEARQQFRARRLRPQAIHLLRRVREIDAWHVDALLDLARLLAKTGQEVEAGLLLSGLAERALGGALRHVRAAQFRMDPTPARAWQWLRAVFPRAAGRESEALSP